MIIGIDVSTISKNKAGIGHYTYSITKALLSNDTENKYILYTNNIDTLKDFDQFSNSEIIEFKTKTPNFYWIFKVFNHFNKKVDIFLSPGNFTFGLLSEKVVQVIHDLAPIKFPQFFSKKGSFMFNIQLKLAIHNFKHIIAVSNNTKNEIVEHFKISEAKISIVGEGVNDWIKVPRDNIKEEIVKEKYNLPDKFILSVGTLEPRKNHINMIKGFAKFSKSNNDYHYAIVGKKGWFYDEIFNTVKDCKIDQKVHFLGYVPDEDLAYIYDQASLFMYLSFYEGFGLPLIEAQARGKKVLASDIPVFKEVLQGSTLLADPSDISDISSKIAQLIGEVQINNYTNPQLYDWSKSGKKLLEIITSISK
jgi:glycosyltransferase involved in cell wall biosynthesis